MSGKRVMLIDDDEIDNYSHRRSLQQCDWVKEIMVYEYAEEALERLKTDAGCADLIFLDINMPRMNGFEFLEQYQQLPPENRTGIMVMMLTTSDSPVDRDRASKFGCVSDFMTKPLSGDTLTKLVDRVLKQRFQADP